jgi:hypothetical protein
MSAWVDVIQGAVDREFELKQQLLAAEAEIARLRGLLRGAEGLGSHALTKVGWCPWCKCCIFAETGEVMWHGDKCLVFTRERELK